MLIKDSMSVSLKHQNVDVFLFLTLCKKEKNISAERLRSNCEMRPCC